MLGYDFDDRQRLDTSPEKLLCLSAGQPFVLKHGPHDLASNGIHAPLAHLCPEKPAVVAGGNKLGPAEQLQAFLQGAVVKGLLRGQP